ncbi:MAG: D-alanine--D-alanine ligase [Alphaproteobacteria bacterium]|nr:D-alanine--D-alanine ligase [Alphaproteobacteria bacterium]
MTKKVAVLMGGRSSEREVSLASGNNVLKALKDAGYQVFGIDVTDDLKALITELENQKPDVVFNALHGKYGEDGCIQGILDFMGIPYTHSGRMASALAMDKVMAKKMYRSVGLPVATERVVTKGQILAGDVLPYPFVLKPIGDGSSVGVFIFETDSGKKPFEGEKYPYADDEKILAEEYIPGRELTVAVMDGKPLGILEIIPATEFYNYKNKYSQGGARHIVPTDIPREDQEEIMRIAAEAHKVLGCRGISRSDIRYDDTRKDEKARCIILETNTQPGMTSLSLVPDIARNVGYSYQDIVVWMVENAGCAS